MHAAVRDQPFGIRLGVLRGERVRGIVEPHHIGTRIVDESHAPHAGAIHDVEQRAWIVHEGQQEIPMGFLPPAHRLLDLGFEVAPWLDVDVHVGDATQSLQV